MMKIASQRKKKRTARIFALRSRFSLKVPAFAKAVFGLSILSLLIHVSFYISSSFADWFNFTVASFLRDLLARISALIPFSVAEALILLIVPLFIAALVYGFLLKDELKQTRFLCLLLSFILLLYSLFVLIFASGYRGSTLDRKMKIETVAVSENDLYDTALWLIDEIDALSPEIALDADGASVMPFGFDRMTEEIRASYESLRDQYHFIPYSSGRAKPVAMSRAMSYTRILGVYTFFTGEANVNPNFNDFSTAFTAAHEMAHQRGFAREDEANMMAFLACTNSDVPYLRYAGYFEMLRYVLSALSSSSSMYYAEAWYRTPAFARSDQEFYEARFAPYRDSVVGNVSGTVNDAYLKLQGTEGKKSYGLVVDLAVALYRSEER